MASGSTSAIHAAVAQQLWARALAANGAEGPPAIVTTEVVGIGAGVSLPRCLFSFSFLRWESLTRAPFAVFLVHRLVASLSFARR
jgi:hypothetical protein